MDYNAKAAAASAYAQQQQGMNAVSGSLASAPDVRPTELGDLDRRLRVAGERVALLANNIGALGDRLYGAVPQDGEDANSTPHPGSGLGMIRMRMETIEAWLTQAEQYLDRINNIA